MNDALVVQLLQRAGLAAVFLLISEAESVAECTQDDIWQMQQSMAWEDIDRVCGGQTALPGSRTIPAPGSERVPERSHIANEDDLSGRWWFTASSYEGDKESIRLEIKKVNEIRYEVRGTKHDVTFSGILSPSGEKWTLTMHSSEGTRFDAEFRKSGNILSGTCSTTRRQHPGSCVMTPL